MKKNISVKKNRKDNEQEVRLILADFYKKSSAMVEAAIKKSHEDYPEMFGLR